MSQRPQKKIRHFRVEDELWDTAKATAERRGDVLSEVIRAALQRYVNRHK